MRKLLSTTAAILALGACVEAPDRAHEAAVVLEACDAAADLAETTARQHQRGVPLEAILAKLDQVEARADEIDFYPEVRAEIIDIYARPRFDTAEAQARAVARERDRAHSECMREAHFRLAR